MRKSLMCSAVALLVGLAACGTPAPVPAGGSPAPASSVTPAQGVQMVASACQAIQPTVSAVPGAMSGANAAAQAQANNILSYEQSACASAETINAVVASDPTGGAQTATWVAALGAGLVQALPAILKATGSISANELRLPALI